MFATDLRCSRAVRVAVQEGGEGVSIKVPFLAEVWDEHHASAHLQRKNEEMVAVGNESSGSHIIVGGGCNGGVVGVVAAVIRH